MSASVTRLPRKAGLVASVDAAIDAMTWLTDSDAGMVALAREYAAAIESSEDDKVKRMMGPHLESVLRALGGAPPERKALGVADRPRGRLAELRAAR